MKLFVSYWAMMNGGGMSDSFIGNHQFTADNLGISSDKIIIGDICDVELLESEVKSYLQSEQLDVSAVSIINWRKFD